LYKLLVADDEQIVLDSIRYIVEKDFRDIMTIETSSSGLDAIEKAEIQKPDIIFMDIKMPGINGIDAIKEIKHTYNNAIFIIITAYEQFDFAKEAVNLGVLEYLLKPVNRSKIVEILHKAIRLIEEDRRKRKKELELKEKMQSIMPVLEHGFIYSILLYKDFNDELGQYRKILDITENSGYIMTVEFGQEESPGNLGNKIGSSVLSQSFYPYFKDVLKERCKCIIGPVILNRIVVYIPVFNAEDEYPQRIEAVSIAEYLFKKLSCRVDADFYIGIGRLCRGVENLAGSYEDSLKAIRYAGGKGIMHIKDIPAGSLHNSEYPAIKEKLVIEKASTGEIRSCIQTFNHVFEWYAAEYGRAVKPVKERLVELMVTLHRLAWDYGVEEGELLRRQDYLSEMLSINELSSLKVWCIRRIEHISSGISRLRKKRLSTIIANAVRFIDANFIRDLTLEDVSREVKISPYYFSKLFKEETGENFIDYLTTVRVNKAKEFLEQGLHSVKEICYNVGYSDPNYFSRLFKKVVGLTPTEYKEKIAKY
jgi:two-component system response regulator YesN